MSFSVADELTAEKIDPDNIDPTIVFVTYNILPKNLSIASYRQGAPSHFNLLLCKKCQEKVYQLSSEAQLIFNQEPVTKSDLSIIVMKKEYKFITLSINRSTKSIDYLAFDTVKKPEAEQR